MDIGFRIMECIVEIILGCAFVYTVTDHLQLKKRVKELEELNNTLLVDMTKILNKDNTK